MTNQLAKADAQTLGASCIEFIQPPPGNCAGFVAWWLRSRYVDKVFWSGKRFSQQGPDGPYVQTAVGLSKSAALQAEFVGNNKHRDYITERRRGDKPLKISENSSPKFVSADALEDVSVTGDDAVTMQHTFRHVCNQGWGARICIRTANGSHDIALETSQFPAYFDPNLGEFTFITPDDLCLWWAICYGRRQQYPNSAFGLFGTQFTIEYYSR